MKAGKRKPGKMPAGGIGVIAQRARQRRAMAGVKPNGRFGRTGQTLSHVDKIVMNLFSRGKILSLSDYVF